MELERQKFDHAVNIANSREGRANALATLQWFVQTAGVAIDTQRLGLARTKQTEEIAMAKDAAGLKRAVDVSNVILRARGQELMQAIANGRIGAAAAVEVFQQESINRRAATQNAINAINFGIKKELDPMLREATDEADKDEREFLSVMRGLLTPRDQEPLPIESYFKVEGRKTEEKPVTPGMSWDDYVK
jgi:hypothetical protein